MQEDFAVNNTFRSNQLYGTPCKFTTASFSLLPFMVEPFFDVGSHCFLLMSFQRVQKNNTGNLQIHVIKCFFIVAIYFFQVWL